jgi:hypothetical protein
MDLKAYAHAAPQGQLRIWVGVFGVTTPPALRFQIDGATCQPEGLPQGETGLYVIRDHRGRNHQGLFEFKVPLGGRRHRVDVFAGAQTYTLITQSLPDHLPGTLDGEFHLLLTSCYFQPNDGGGLLGTVVQQLRRQPDMVLLAGDQVYLDLPLFEDLPEAEDALARAVGDKYFKNWTSDTLGIPGLAPVLSRAPVVCLPDDHEFWNNFPYKQKQLPNLWRSEVKERWKRSALALYQDYQVGGKPQAVPRGAVRINVLPMRMLFVDMRCARDDQFNTLMSPDARAALMQWADDLLKAHQHGEPAVGLLSSGQALFITPPLEESKKRDVDAEMGNYREFDDVLAQIGRLTDAGIPVVYVTGDVHWSRVAKATDAISNRTLLYEVICSPSRLISTPLADTFKEFKSLVGGIFGPKDPWPRHPALDKLPDGMGPNRRYRPTQELGRRGDQVAVLSFTGGANVSMSVTYYAIHDDKGLAKSQTVGPYVLNNI